MAAYLGVNINNNHIAKRAPSRHDGALPLILKRPTNSWDSKNLDDYYRDCVIGGLGAIMLSVRERHQFAEAIKTKIIGEIAGAAPEALIVTTQAQSERSVTARWEPTHGRTDANPGSIRIDGAVGDTLVQIAAHSA